MSSSCGTLLVDKPSGRTSHDVVLELRRALGISKIGHFGTLDPLATGVLIAACGRATRLFPFFQAHDKTYEARVRLGFSTDTYDSEGAPTSPVSDLIPGEAEVRAALTTFLGAQDQTPPAYSAKKLHGKPAYKRARKSEPVARKPSPVIVHEIALTAFRPPELEFRVRCSAGTYVRSLAHDLGEALGCGAHLVGLRRTKSGRFSLRDAVPLRKLQEAFHAGNWYQYLIPAAEALGDWPAIELSPDDVEGVRHGHRVKAVEGTAVGDRVRGVSTQGELVSLMECVIGEDGAPAWQPKKVFFTSD